MTLLDTFWFSLSVTSPIFLWMLGGYGLARLGCFPAALRNQINRLIFYVSLPLLMFVSILKQPLGEVWEPTLTALLCGVTFVLFALAKLWSRQAANFRRFGEMDHAGGAGGAGGSGGLGQHKELQAALVAQASFRGNLGIIGIYLCLQAFGEAVLPVASLLMALLSILYNALAVFVFEAALIQQNHRQPAYLQWRVWLNILLNPLIMATLFALLLSGAGVALPASGLALGDTFVAWTLPLALMSIGASMGVSSSGAKPSNLVLPKHMSPMCIMLTLKLLVKPLLAVSLAWLLGYRGMLLGTVFFFTAAPTAAASFVVAKAYGADERLAARVIVYSGALSLLSISAGVFILRGLGLM